MLAGSRQKNELSSGPRISRWLNLWSTLVQCTAYVMSTQIVNIFRSCLQMILMTLFSLKTMESLQIGVATHFQVTPLLSIRTESIVSPQSCRSFDADAWCTLVYFCCWITKHAVHWDMEFGGCGIGMGLPSDWDAIWSNWSMLKCMGACWIRLRG